MALPVGVTTATVIAGVPVSHTGAAVKSFLSIEPSVFLVHTATGTPLVDFLEELDISEGVAGQFNLPHTDQTGFQDENGNAYTNWYYTARITYSTPSKAKTKPPKIKVFQLPAGQTVVDLDRLPSGAPALPYTAPIATVTSINGRTGTITIEDADLPERLSDTALTATYAPKSLETTVAGKLDVTAAAATYARPRPGTITLLGDSITAMNHAVTGVTTALSSFGFWSHANQRLNARLKLVARTGTLNGGVSGENTTQILARVQQDVVALNPGYAHVLAGTNDVIGGTLGLSTTLANLTSIYDAIQNAGIRLVVGTIPPFSGGTTAQLVYIDQVNQFVRDQARARPGVILADYHSVLAGPTGSWRVIGTTDYAGDDRHPSTGGAMRMGKVLADALSPVIPAGSVLPTSNVDAYANRASFTVPNLIVNPMMTGTAGSANGSGLTNLADSWTIATYDGSATSGLSTVGSSKVARTDGIVGEWQQFVLPSVASKLRFQQSIGSGGTLPVAGDRVWCHVEYELENVTDLDVFRAQLTAFDAGAGYASRAISIDFNMNTADINNIPMSHIPAGGVLTTPVITVPATTITGWTMAVDIAAAGTLRIGRVAWRRER